MSSQLPNLTFTTVYRTTIYTYTNISFTEADFIALLSDEKKAKWEALGPVKRGVLWAKLKENFPFELGEKGKYDPHLNWIESWDDEEIKENNVKWDCHDHIKSEIITAFDHMKE